MPNNLRFNPFRQAFEEMPEEILENPKRGEDLFDLILTGVKEVFEVEGVIAGGAVRDLAAGITTPKDVDLWLPIDAERFWEVEGELGWRNVAKQTTTVKMKTGYTCAVPVEERISARVQGLPLDVLLLGKDKPLTPDMVAKFPVHAQRWVYTREGLVSGTPEANKDLFQKQFTIDPTVCDTKEKVKNVLDKVNGWKQREHYKDWKVVEPDIPEWWEAKKAIEKDDAKKQVKLKKKGPEWNEDWAKFWEDDMQRIRDRVRAAEER